METADYDPVAARACGNHLRHDFGRIGVLDFYQQIDRRILGEYQEVGEDDRIRHPRLELGEAQVGHALIVDREVVTDDDDAVAGRLDIAFDRIRTFAERGLERWP